MNKRDVSTHLSMSHFYMSVSSTTVSWRETRGRKEKNLCPRLYQVIKTQRTEETQMARWDENICRGGLGGRTNNTHTHIKPGEERFVWEVARSYFGLERGQIFITIIIIIMVEDNNHSCTDVTILIHSFIIVYNHHFLNCITKLAYTFLSEHQPTPTHHSHSHSFTHSPMT